MMFLSSPANWEGSMASKSGSEGRLDQSRLYVLDDAMVREAMRVRLLDECDPFALLWGVVAERKA